MEAHARVQRIAGGKLWVKVNDSGGGCGRCDEPGGCRSVQISHAFGVPNNEFALPLMPGIKVGDRVRISIPDGAPLRLALASYGLGVLLLLAGAGLGGLSGDGAAADLHAALGACAGLIVAVFINRLLARSRWWRRNLDMEVMPEDACVRSGLAGTQR